MGGWVRGWCPDVGVQSIPWRRGRWRRVRDKEDDQYLRERRFLGEQMMRGEYYCCGDGLVNRVTSQQLIRTQVLKHHF